MTRRTKIWLTMMIVLLLLVVGSVGLLVVAPMIIYQEVRDVADMRLRSGAIRRLSGYGPLGRAYVLDMVSASFHEWRDSGSSFAIIPGAFPVGCHREEIQAVLGPPDILMGDHDIWWLMREEKHRIFLSEEESERTTGWNERLVAEYDREGRLERLFIPGMITDNQWQLPAPERFPPPLEAPPVK